MKQPNQNQLDDLRYLVEEYVALIDIIDSSAEVKAKLGPLMDDQGDNNPEMAFAGLDLDRDKAKTLLEELE